ncbi:hypothetical protein CSA56_08405 [candidate division KSB3 bacterium]|uniref:Carbohydrate kinase PfkB domain-containing protein n=1 Tax=candidate division KSB3 bacterium TaxID=2044937 RepID=A0A2G6KFH4_9BACT|nr:MAG: hypothetical protein CSA56_08405 [candidate division KSB3 bacterium]
MVKILGVGGVCIDQLAVVPRMPKWDDVEHISRYMMQQGGIVATAMVAAARLGEPTEFIGGIGDDDAGQYALKHFEQEQVEAKRVSIIEQAHTAFSFVLVHEKTGKRTIIHHRGVQRLAALPLPPLDLTGIEFLHLDGYWIETALQTARQAKTLGITTIIDPSSICIHKTPQNEELLTLMDYIVPGAGFATAFTHKTQPAETAKVFLQYGCKAVILTNGEQGCLVFTQDGHDHIPAFPVSTVDTTGAGDTFHGAFVAGLSKGYPLLKAVQFASAVAALKCTKLGGQSGIPTFQETQEFLAERGVTL